MKKDGRTLQRAAVLQLIGLLFLTVFYLLSVCSAYAKVWGDAKIGIYPLGSKLVAPNGLTYNPLGHIGIDLNIGQKRLYLFSKSVIIASKADPGVTTNSNQGIFDFSKREMDFKLGAAARPFHSKDLEFRLWAIALNNLNRGTTNDKPNGFKDGEAIEARYYFNRSRLWGYVTGGYYLAKELVAPDGQPFKPGIFVGTKLNYDLFAVPKKLYAFADITSVNLFGRFEGGIAYKPFKSLPDTEMRLSAMKYMDLNEESHDDAGILFEIRHYFTTDKASHIQHDYAEVQRESLAKAPDISEHPTELSATDVWFDVGMMHVRLSDGREVGVPLGWFPKLMGATDTQKKNWHLEDNGTEIHWETLGIDVTVARLLKE